MGISEQSRPIRLLSVASIDHGLRCFRFLGTVRTSFHREKKRMHQSTASLRPCSLALRDLRAVSFLEAWYPATHRARGHCRGSLRRLRWPQGYPGNTSVTTCIHPLILVLYSICNASPPLGQSRVNSSWKHELQDGLEPRRPS